MSAGAAMPHASTIESAGRCVFCGLPANDPGPCEKRPRPERSAATPWEFVQDDTDAAMGTARVLNASNELVCTTSPENADLIVCAVNYLAVERGE